MLADGYNHHRQQPPAIANDIDNTLSSILTVAKPTMLPSFSRRHSPQFEGVHSRCGRFAHGRSFYKFALLENFSLSLLFSSPLTLFRSTHSFITSLSCLVIRSHSIHSFYNTFLDSFNAFSNLKD